MPYITKIERQKRHSKRWSIFIDNQYAFGVDEEIIQRLGLQEDQIVDEKELKKIIFEEEKRKAREYALNLLSIRPRTKKELEQRLKRKEFETEIISKVISRLEEVGLIDDEKFARLWTESRLASKPMGPNRLKEELWQKGISPEIIEESLKEFTNKDEQIGIAKELVKRKTRQYVSLSPEVMKRRLMGFLSRRGFSYEIIKEVLRNETTDPP
ncbi:MAG: RecX family transcriptional regulator [Candidatus Edwardsbacteria bacterium]